MKGISFLINDIIPVEKVFKHKGRRLNETREQKSSVIYAPSKLFITKVMDFMPLISCQLLDLKEHYFAGEMCPLRLELSNYGHKELTNLTVSSSHLHNISFSSMTSIDESCTIDNIISETNSHCLIPNNNLACINPQEQIILPIWIRFEEEGIQDFSFSFEYHSTHGEKRTFQCSYKISVQCLLKLSVEIRDSKKEQDHIWSCLCIENASGHEVFVDSIALRSLNWKTNQNYKSLSIGSSNQEFYVWKMYAQDGNHSCEGRFTEALKEFIVEGNSLLKPTPIIMKSSCRIENILADLLLKSKTSSKLKQLSEKIGKNRDLISLFPLYFSDDVEFVISWSCNGRRGFSTHSIINLGNPSADEIPNLLSIDEIRAKLKSRSLYSQTATEKMQILMQLRQNDSKTPIKVTMKGDDECFHDFSAEKYFYHFNSRILWKTFSISVFNSSWMQAQEYSVKLVNSNEFFWKGLCDFKGIVDPLSEQVLQVTAGFKKQGTFNLNKWLISVDSKSYYPECSFLFKISERLL